MRKLLIADSSDVFTSAVETALRKQFEIFTCADGETALDLLSLHQPDILILNLMLPYVDGLTVLQETAYHPPLIITITMHMSAYVEQAVTTLGVDYTMIAPSAEAVILRLQDLLKQYNAPVQNMDIEAKTIHHLHLLNFHSHLDGYRQLYLALPMFARNPHMLMTKELYPAVAQLCGCKDGRSVEHSIRKAIQAAWRHRDNAIWRKYFTQSSRGTVACPTNKEFICRLAEVLNAQNCLL